MNKVLVLFFLILVTVFLTLSLTNWFNSQQTIIKTKAQTKIENVIKK